MKEIIIKRIHMENFKLFQSKTIDFSKLTKIFAQNYRGKSSIVDAFFWVLFGKSSTGNSEGKQFQPRRYDKDGNPINHVDVIVELELDVDGKPVTVKKVQKQNWVRKRGAEVETYEGDTNEYFWNEVPVKETEHKRRVAEIIDEEVFRMITNPHAFVSKKQDEQRKFLVEKVAQITDEDVFAEIFKGTYSAADEELRDMLQKNTLEEIKAINKKALQDYKQQQEQIPVRIDEVSKSIIDIDFAEQELALSALKEKLTDVENRIADTSKAYDEVNRIKAEIAQVKGELDQIERDAKAKLDGQKYEIVKKIEKLLREQQSVEYEYNMTLANIERKKNNIKRNKEFLEESRRQYASVKAEIAVIENEQFDEKSFNCPTCGQLLPPEEQEVIRSKYETEKKKRIETAQKKLEGVIEQGNLINESIKKDEAEIVELEKKLKEQEENKLQIEKHVAEVQEELDKLPNISVVEYCEGIPRYLDFKVRLSELEKQLDNAVKVTTDTDTLIQSLTAEKKGIQEQIEKVQRTLALKKTIDDAKDRIEELREELRKATQNAADCEKVLFLIEKFEKAKMELLSEKINSKFRLIKWMLFRPQKNGGVEQVCIPMIHGSPYGENTTSSTEQLMIGMDIIATLQEIFEVKAPIFIDNKERFNDWNIPEMDCQMIMLSVSEDEEIRVVNA